MDSESTKQKYTPIMKDESTQTNRNYVMIRSRWGVYYALRPRDGAPVKQPVIQEVKLVERPGDYGTKKYFYVCQQCKVKRPWPAERGKDPCLTSGCTSWHYFVACIHCRRQKLLYRVRDYDCSSCGKKTGISYCYYCRQTQDAAGFEGVHQCQRCNQKSLNTFCTHCKRDFITGEKGTEFECSVCKKKFSPPAEVLGTWPKK